MPRLCGNATQGSIGIKEVDRYHTSFLDSRGSPYPIRPCCCRSRLDPYHRQRGRTQQSSFSSSVLHSSPSVCLLYTRPQPHSQALKERTSCIRLVHFLVRSQLGRGIDLHQRGRHLGRQYRSQPKQNASQSSAIPPARYPTQSHSKVRTAPFTRPTSSFRTPTPAFQSGPRRTTGSSTRPRTTPIHQPISYKSSSKVP